MRFALPDEAMVGGLGRLSASDVTVTYFRVVSRFRMFSGGDFEMPFPALSTRKALFNRGLRPDIEDDVRRNQ